MILRCVIAYSGCRSLDGCGWKADVRFVLVLMSFYVQVEHKASMHKADGVEWRVVDADFRMVLD
jgi:hypothetical protein